MKKYRIGLYEKAMPDELNWREKLICAKECGYDFVEISIDESEARLSRLNWTKEERQSICRDMEEVGIRIRSMCLSGHRKYPLGSKDPVVRKRGLEIMEKALKLADDLGIRTIQLAGYDVYYEEGTEEARQLFEDNLQKAVEMAASYGIIMGFETMETEFMNTVGKSMTYVKTVENPYLGVYPDAGNLTNAAVLYGTDVIDDLKAGAGHLIALHLKPTAPGVFRNLYFDDSTQHVDFVHVINAAWKLGVRRYVTELWSLGRPEWKENILTANRMMRDILDQQMLEEQKFETMQQ